jgi:zinc transport system substrate-binding protein
MKKIVLLTLFISSLLFAQKEQISVNILPQKYFVEKIVQDKFEINVMVNPGSSPHNFEPKPSQMKSLAKSKIYFISGDNSELAWIDRFKQNAKDTLFVDSVKDIVKIPMTEHHHHEEDAHHDHDAHDHEHDEDSLDPHTWLDPINVKTIAKNIYEAVILVDEKNRDFYENNYNKFLIELDNLDLELKNILEPYKNRAFMVFHPSWGYFAARYNLNQIAVESQGKEPKPNELVNLINEAKEYDIKVVFTSPQFSKKAATVISENIKGNVEVIDPLSIDWENNLINTAKLIEKSYK